LTVLIDDRQNQLEVKEKLLELIKKTIKTVLDYEKCTINYEVSISLVDNEEIKDLNKNFRNIDTVTDVLSFPMIGFDEGNENSIINGDKGLDPLLGDIVISLEKAKEQALEYGHSVERELVFLLIHGMLHLLGHDHLDENDEREMISKQKEILKQLNYSL